jgi:Ran GTPase-activating protein (RanGAP) involved in mRNA processing and transport
MLLQTSSNMREHLADFKPLLAIKARSGQSARELNRDLNLKMIHYEIQSITLDNVDLNSDESDLLLETIQRCEKLSTLNIGECGITFKNAANSRVLSVLAHCKSLVHLNLFGNEICEDGVGMLAAVLPDCPCLTHLDLCGNLFFHAEAIKVLARALPRCKLLRYLDLSENSLGYEGAWRLAGVLPECPALAHLNLSHTRIQDAGMVGIDECDRHRYQDAGMVQGLIAALPQCTSLTHLNLCHAWLGLTYSEDRGVTGLAAILPQCLELVHLDLRDNEIGPTGVRSLRAAELECPSLTIVRN